MMRTVACMVIGGALLALSFHSDASTAQNFDPRDPSVWEDEKSDIQRERERREQQRLQNEYERRWRRD